MIDSDVIINYARVGHDVRMCIGAKFIDGEWKYGKPVDISISNCERSNAQMLRTRQWKQINRILMADFEIFSIFGAPVAVLYRPATTQRSAALACVKLMHDRVIQKLKEDAQS